jgi:hypothetical protein
MRRNKRGLLVKKIEGRSAYWARLIPGMTRLTEVLYSVVHFPKRTLLSGGTVRWDEEVLLPAAGLENRNRAFTNPGNPKKL